MENDAITQCLVGKPDGLSLGDISTLSKIDKDTARITLKELISKGVVGEKGKTRGHRYYLMSEIVLGTKDVMRPEPVSQPPPIPIEVPVVKKAEVKTSELRECAVRTVKENGRIYKLALLKIICVAYPDTKPESITRVISDLGENDGLKWAHSHVVEVIQ